MTHSMTGFATLKGHYGGYGWVWDIRAVNARGLDIRLRLPDWIDGLEVAVRKAVSDAIVRGSINLSLRVQREAEAGDATLNTDALERILSNLVEVSHIAEQRGVALSHPSAVEISGLRGVLDNSSPDEDTAPLLKALIAQVPQLLSAFNQMRAREGGSLDTLLNGQLDQVAKMVAASEAMLDDRQEAQKTGLKASLARVLDNADGADPDRVAQELALIAVKTDVREEIDRLKAHVEAAHELLASDGARGRKLDFLMQEFNREANTLCSKAQYQPLTRIGLDLKAVIDQMREQVQNVE